LTIEATQLDTPEEAAAEDAGDLGGLVTTMYLEVLVMKEVKKHLQKNLLTLEAMKH
jgi:hypothetical protein